MAGLKARTTAMSFTSRSAGRRQRDGRNVAVVKALVARGADVNATITETGQTA